MKRSDAVLWVILAVALILRLWMAATWPLPLGGDELDYHRLGISIAQGAGMVNGLGRPSSFRPPAYPAMVGAVYAVAGVQPVAVRIAQAFLGAATVLLVFLLGRTLAGTAVGLVAAGLVAVDLGQVSVGGRLLSEGPFTLVLLGMVLLTVRAAVALRRGGEGWRDAAAAGVLGGVGALLRGILLPYPPLVALALLWSGRNRLRPAGRAAAALLVGWVVVLVPWTVRNAAAQGAFVPVTTQVGITFYSSQNPPEGRLFGILATDSMVQSVAGFSEPARSSALLQAGLDSLRADPGRIPRLATMKLLFFAVPFDWEVLARYGALNPSYAFVVIWAVVALFLAVRAGAMRRLGGLWPVWLPAAFFLAMALVFYGSPRFRLPIEPLGAMAAAWAMVETARRSTVMRAVTWAAATGAPLVALFVVGDRAKTAVRSIMQLLGLWS